MANSRSFTSRSSARCRIRLDRLPLCCGKGRKLKSFASRSIKKHRWIQHWYGTSMPRTIGHSGTEHRQSSVPCVIAELYTDSLRDAPVGRKDTETLFLIVDQGTSQPGISSVHFVQPGHVQTLMEHYLIV